MEERDLFGNKIENINLKNLKNIFFDICRIGNIRILRPQGVENRNIKAGFQNLENINIVNYPHKNLKEKVREKALIFLKK